ncbi:MAG: type II CAAX endopeptidase family protein [Gemmatimonadota bacterium]
MPTPSVDLIDGILLVLLLVLMPAFALAQASVLDRVPFDRLQAYWSSMAALWVLGATSWLVGTREGGLRAIGLVPLPMLELVAWSLGLAAAGVALMLVFKVIGSWANVPETPVLAQLLPRTERERRVFGLLSVAAGVGEEVAYRGYAIPTLAVSVGVPWSVAITSTLFGVLHAYQGVLGMIRTALMGAVLAGGFIASGSLLPVIIGHTLVDLLAGLVIADWFIEDLAETTNQGNG